MLVLVRLRVIHSTPPDHIAQTLSAQWQTAATVASALHQHGAAAGCPTPSTVVPPPLPRTPPLAWGGTDQPAAS